MKKKPIKKAKPAPKKKPINAKRKRPKKPSFPAKAIRDDFEMNGDQ